MAKTKKKNRVVPEIRQSAQQIWLAGIGALSLAEEGGAKVVRFAGMESGRLFKALVKKGSAYEAKNRKRLNAVLGSAGDAPYRAVETIGKIGSNIDRRASSAVRKIRVPTSRAIARPTRSAKGPNGP